MNFFKVSRFFLFASVFCVLIVSTTTLFPFIVGKGIFFRAAIDLALLFFALGLIFQNGEWETLKTRIKNIFREPLAIAVSVFVSFFLLACLFAYDPGAAFWSNFERGEGGLQLIHFFILFFLSLALFRNEDDWKKFFRVFIAAASLVIVYGIAGWMKIRGFISPSGICDRFQGSLGNPAYVAPLLLFASFFTLWLFLKGGKTMKRKIGYGTLLVIFALFFLLTQTRGAFLGLGVGLILAFLYLAVKLPKGNFKIASIVLFIALTLFGTLAAVFRHNNIPLVPFCSSSGRLLDISVSDQTAQTRLWTWGEAIKAWKERPVFGWGPENFSVAFDKYFDSRFFNPDGSSETWFDRAHSVFFDYLAETGTLGFLAYLGIFMTFAIKFFRNKFSADARENTLLLGIIVAYLGQGAILFDVTPIYLPFFITLAFLVNKLIENRNQTGVKKI
ncbi:MAG: O-antigen ligase family protein [Minisyncoccia bacterium]